MNYFVLLMLILTFILQCSDSRGEEKSSSSTLVKLSPAENHKTNIPDPLMNKLTSPSPNEVELAQSDGLTSNNAAISKTDKDEEISNHINSSESNPGTDNNTEISNHIGSPEPNAGILPVSGSEENDVTWTGFPYGTSRQSSDSPSSETSAEKFPEEEQSGIKYPQGSSGSQNPSLRPSTGRLLGVLIPCQSKCVRNPISGVCPQPAITQSRKILHVPFILSKKECPIPVPSKIPTVYYGPIDAYSCNHPRFFILNDTTEYSKEAKIPESKVLVIFVRPIDTLKRPPPQIPPPQASNINFGVLPGEVLSLQNGTLHSVRRFEFKWPEGRVTVTFYSYSDELTLADQRIFKKINKYVEFLERAMTTPRKCPLRRVLNKLLGSSSSINPENDNDKPKLFYGDRWIQHKVVVKQKDNLEIDTKIDVTQIVIRVLFRWAGSELMVTYFGTLPKVTMDDKKFIEKVYEVGNYTIDDINSKIFTHVVDDTYLIL